MEIRTAEEINEIELHEQLVYINEFIESLRKVNNLRQSPEYWSAIAEKQYIIHMLDKLNRYNSF